MEQSAKKSLGQHWLNDEKALRAIADAAELIRGELVLEIGPGHGVLTDELIERGVRVQALEFDAELARELAGRYSGRPDVSIQEGDIRRFNFSAMGGDYKIVANIPYYLTSHLIRQLTELAEKPQRVVLLIQKEVAERVVAVDGKMSLLSCIAQLHFDASLGIVVPAASFTPPPKVDSQVLILQARKKPLYAVDERVLVRLMKAGFSGKRKTLRNALHGGLRIEKPAIETLLDSASIDPDARAERLTLEDWYRLYKAYLTR